MSITTHVLDTAHGVPAAQVAVTLRRRHEGHWEELASVHTDSAGRADFGARAGARPGVYSLHFETGAYYAARGVATLYPDVDVKFELTTAGPCHLPLLLGPYGYSTYRGC